MLITPVTLIISNHQYFLKCIHYSVPVNTVDSFPQKASTASINIDFHHDPLVYDLPTKLFSGPLHAWIWVNYRTDAAQTARYYDCTQRKLADHISLT